MSGDAFASRDCKTPGCGGEAAWARGPLAGLCTKCAAVKKRKLGEVNAQARQKGADAAAGRQLSAAHRRPLVAVASSGPPLGSEPAAADPVEGEPAPARIDVTAEGQALAAKRAEGLADAAKRVAEVLIGVGRDLDAARQRCEELAGEYRAARLEVIRLERSWHDGVSELVDLGAATDGGRGMSDG